MTKRTVEDLEEDLRRDDARTGGVVEERSVVRVAVGKIRRAEARANLVLPEPLPVALLPVLQVLPLAVLLAVDLVVALKPKSKLNRPPARRRQRPLAAANLEIPIQVSLNLVANRSLTLAVVQSLLIISRATALEEEAEAEVLSVL